MNDLIRLAAERACELFERGGSIFNGAGFSQTFCRLAGVRGPIDGLVVRTMLAGRRDVDILRGGAHYRLRADREEGHGEGAEDVITPASKQEKSEFWKSVSELAEQAKNIPQEVREMSGVAKPTPQAERLRGEIEDTKVCEENTLVERLRADREDLLGELGWFRRRARAWKQLARHYKDMWIAAALDYDGYYIGLITQECGEGGEG